MALPGGERSHWERMRNDPAEDSCEAWFSQDLLAPLHAAHAARRLQGLPTHDALMISPDLPPPRVMVDRLVEASVKPGAHRYSSSRGIRKLREAFQRKYERAFGVRLDPDDEVCVALGTKDALLQTLRAVTHPGDEVLVGTPLYPAYRSIFQALGLRWRTFEVSSGAEENLRRILEVLSTARVLLLNFPNNPTGVVANLDFYAALGRALHERDILVVNDFAYGELGFSGAPVSLLSCQELRSKAVEIYSLSKAYRVPGWRVAALVGMPAVVRSVQRLKSHLDYGLFTPLQMAAAAGLAADVACVREACEVFQRRAALWSEGLSLAGWRVRPPLAGACVWAEAPRTLVGVGTVGGATSLLGRCGVLGMPGELFGSEWSNYMRFACVSPEAEIRTALAALCQNAGEGGPSPG